MAYTPELEKRHSCTLRRIAWAMGKPMTEAIQDVFEYVAARTNRMIICQKCKDISKCRDCAINQSFVVSNIEGIMNL